MKARFFPLAALLMSVVLLVLVTAGSVEPQRVVDVPVLRELPRPYQESEITLTQGDTYSLCLRVYTGTLRSTVVISNADGISDFEEHSLVNFDQRLVSKSDTALEIEITSQRFLDTGAPYPVNTGALPEGVRKYLRPESGWIQSDDPEIVAQVTELVSGATTQAQAVDAIQAWVRGEIHYDYTFSLPADASSVFRNRSGVCSGFSTLITAMLRAAGIPAQYEVGCVARWGDGWGWVVGDEGSWHAWVRFYYPDVGWVAADPQVSVNYLDTGHILSGFDECGEEGTVITRTNHLVDGDFLYDLRTPYGNATWRNLWLANILDWDRYPLTVVPVVTDIMVSVDEPTGSLALWVEDRGCVSPDWIVITEAPWLTPPYVTGATAGIAHFTVDASGMLPGVYTSPMTAYTKPPFSWPEILSRTITATLRVVPVLHRSYIPFAANAE